MFAEQKRSRRAARRPGAPGRPLPEGGGLRHQVASAAACRRWCCSATSSATTPTPWRAPPREVVRIANSRSGEGFVAVSPEARKKFWLDRKRTAAISKHTNAFKINEDVVIPLPRMGEYTDGIERINIELSLAQQARAGRRARGLLRAAATCRWARATTPARSPSAELLEDRVQQALALLREVARAVARLARRPRPASRDRRSCLRAAAGPHAARLAGRRRSARRCKRSSPARRSRRSSTNASAIHKRRAQGPRLGRAAHARRRRQRAHQHPGQQRRLRDAADRARGGGAHHGAGAQPRRRDLGRARHRHHQARVPDRRRARSPSPTTSSRSTPKAASTRASCCAARAGRRGRPRAARRPDQRLHAELRPDGARVADHAAERHRRHRRQRSRTACAAASASRCARPTCRAPTCCTARATRSSPPRCWSRPSCTRSRRAAASRSSTGRSSRTWPTTAPSATSA